jgi:hypothetical protein
MKMKLGGFLEHFVAARKIAGEDFSLEVHEGVKAKVAVADELEVAHSACVGFSERNLLVDTENVFM